jgi:hypothetical protein
MTYRGPRREELSGSRDGRPGDVIEVWFQTGTPSSVFEITTTSGTQYGFGCVNHKSLNDISPTCLLCATAFNSSTAARDHLACASETVDILPEVTYRVTAQQSQSRLLTVSLYRDSQTSAVADVSFTVPQTVSGLKGNIRITQAPGPGYLCVQQVRVSNPEVCPASQYISWSESSQSCCSNCTDMTTPCECSCSATMLPTSGSLSCG